MHEGDLLMVPASRRETAALLQVSSPRVVFLDNVQLPHLQCRLLTGQWAPWLADSQTWTSPWDAAARRCSRHPFLRCPQPGGPIDPDGLLDCRRRVMLCGIPRRGTIWSFRERFKVHRVLTRSGRVIDVALPASCSCGCICLVGG